MLEDLMDMLPDDEDWDEILKELNRLVEHHVAEEENTLFPKAQQVLGEEKVKELAELIQREKESLQRDYESV